MKNELEQRLLAYIFRLRLVTSFPKLKDSRARDICDQTCTFSYCPLSIPLWKEYEMIRSLISWFKNTVQQLPLNPEKHGHNHYGFFIFRHARALWFSYKRFQLQLIAS